MTKTHKCALVIGGGRGIGRAVSIRLSHDGHHVLVNYRSNTAEAEKTLHDVRAAGGSGELVQFDITDRTKTADVLKNILTLQKIDALVLSAGIRRDELLVFMPEDQWDEIIDI